MNLYLFRHLQPANITPLPSLLKWYLLVQAVGLGLYTIALLIAPVASTAFWPWHIDEFHGRMYSAIFLTGAVGAYVLWRSAAAVELLLLGVTQSVLGLFAILGVIIVNASQHTVNWAQPGTWIWSGTGSPGCLSIVRVHAKMDTLHEPGEAFQPHMHLVAHPVGCCPLRGLIPLAPQANLSSGDRLPGLLTTSYQ